MKCITLIEYRGYCALQAKVKKWLYDNKESTSEICKIEYEQHGDVYLARISYKPINDKSNM